MISICLVFFLAGCSYETACTADFRAYTVMVENEQGIPVTNATTTETTGQVLPTEDRFADGTEGRYVLVDDNSHSLLDMGKTTVLFTVSSDKKTKTTRYEVEVNACRVLGYEGPGVIILE